MLLTSLLFTLADMCIVTTTLTVLQDQSGAPYPVMVYMFGGGYIQGGNIQYPGHFLAAEDVVVVIPNYRLSTLGKVSSSLLVK